jgi:hypothetical protein
MAHFLEGGRHFIGYAADEPGSSDGISGQYFAGKF